MIGLVAVCKNERNLVAEWLAFHAAVGFDRVVLYDNNSDDGTAKAARDMRGIAVDVIPWSSRAQDYQTSAYDDAVKRYGRRFEWVAFLDLDEFLLPIRDGSVGAFASRVGGDAEGIAVNWALYGSSGRLDAPAGLVTENYLRRAGDTAWFNNHVKTLVRPRAYIRAENPHFVRISGRYVGGDGAPVDWGSDGLTVTPRGLRDIRVNHYFTRSRADWTRKLARGYNNDSRSMEDFERYDRNEVYDDAALAVAARLRRQAEFASRPAVAPPPPYVSPLPADFDPAAYLALNPDVRAAGMEAETHFLDAGRSEGRRYRL